MTIAKLGRLRGANELAQYYKFGAEWMLNVAEVMGADVSRQRNIVFDAHRAMLQGNTNIDPTRSRSIVSVLKGDAFWYGPYTQWLPRGWKRMLKALSRPMKRNLNSTADLYSMNIDAFNSPNFSTPEKVVVNGEKATKFVSGFDDRFVLGASLLHTEWFFDVIDDHDIELSDGLEQQVLHESKLYFTGQSNRLSPDVRRFQRSAFNQDDIWINRVNDEYNMNSRIMRRGARVTGEVADEL